MLFGCFRDLKDFRIGVYLIFKQNPHGRLSAMLRRDQKRVMLHCKQTTQFVARGKE
jgi:hypothetical protein